MTNLGGPSGPPRFFPTNRFGRESDERPIDQRTGWNPVHGFTEETAETSGPLILANKSWKRESSSMCHSSRKQPVPVTRQSSRRRLGGGPSSCPRELLGKTKPVGCGTSTRFRRFAVQEMTASRSFPSCCRIKIDQHRDGASTMRGRLTFSLNLHQFEPLSLGENTVHGAIAKTRDGLPFQRNRVTISRRESDEWCHAHLVGFGEEK